MKKLYILISAFLAISLISGCSSIDSDITKVIDTDSLLVEEIKPNFSITYIGDDESVISIDIYQENSVISEIEAPLKEGFKFVGWSPSLPERMPTIDLVVTANYELMEFSLSLSAQANENIFSYEDFQRRPFIASYFGDVWSHFTFGNFGDELHQGEYVLGHHYFINQEAELFYTNFGRVFAWGSNVNGNTAAGLLSGRTEKPLDVTQNLLLSQEDKIIKIDRNLILTSDGRVITWGQFADLDNLSFDSPVGVELTDRFNLTPDEKVIDFMQEYYGRIFLTNKGRILAYGSDYVYFLMTELNWVNDASFTLKNIKDLTPKFSLMRNEIITNFVVSTEYSEGQNRTIVQTNQGRIFVWGWNPLWLGTNLTEHVDGDVKIYTIDHPEDVTNRLNLNRDEKIIKSLDSSTFGYDGKMYIITSYGRLLVIANQGAPVEDFTPMFGLNRNEKILTMQSVFGHYLVLTSENNVYTWGNNNIGSLGHGTLSATDIPVNITPNIRFVYKDEFIAYAIFPYNGSSLILISNYGNFYLSGYLDLGNRAPNKVSFRVPTLLEHYHELQDDEHIVRFYRNSFITSKGNVFQTGVRDFYLYSYKLIDTPSQIELIETSTTYGQIIDLQGLVLDLVDIGLPLVLINESISNIEDNKINIKSNVIINLTIKENHLEIVVKDVIN